MQFISNITEWQSNCRKHNCPSNATRHVGYRRNLSFEPKSFILLCVFIDSKKPIAFAFNLRFYRATLFRKDLFGCLLACEQALLFGQAKRASRERASKGLCRSLARSPETRLTRPNRRACSQATSLREF